MLQMSCPQCKGLITSPFLAEVSSVECTHCREKVAVEEVYVATEHFTMHRGDFLNRIFRFQKLLGEVEKERNILANDETASKKSRESIDKFYASLQELLAGARDSYRMAVPEDMPVDVRHQNKVIKGSLINVSAEGASIEFAESQDVPRKKSEIEISLALPGCDDPLHIPTSVVWAREQKGGPSPHNATIGVTFKHMTDESRACLWNYILDNAPTSLQRSSR